MSVPKTLAQHKKDRTYRADRHGTRAESSFSVGTPERPDRIPADAEWLWDLVVSEYPPGGQCPLDAVKLESLCRWWSRWHGWDSRLDGCEPEEEYKIAMLAVAAWKQCEKIAMGFGMSGLDRARLKTPPAPVASDDPLEQLRNMGVRIA